MLVTGNGISFAVTKFVQVFLAKSKIVVLEHMYSINIDSYRPEIHWEYIGLELGRDFVLCTHAWHLVSKALSKFLSSIFRSLTYIISPIVLNVSLSRQDQFMSAALAIVEGILIFSPHCSQSRGCTSKF